MIREGPESRTTTFWSGKTMLGGEHIHGPGRLVKYELSYICLATSFAVLDIWPAAARPATLTWSLAKYHYCTYLTLQSNRSELKTGRLQSDDAIGHARRTNQ